MAARYRLALHHSLDDIDPAQWDAWVGKDPFMRHGVLQALHQTGCASPSTGWTPLVLALHDAGGLGQTSEPESMADHTAPGDTSLVGAMLLYAKRHSRGEYVFDHAWADAYARHGLAYYPKLLCAVPFTPVAGPRLLADTHEARVALARAATHLAEQNGLSSVHVLFPCDDDLNALRAAGYMLRQDIQFHWRNAGYSDISDFLTTLSHDKRKKILQDRKRVARSEVSFEWRTGAAITAGDLDFFYDCYALTYRQHGNAPYLSREAFDRMATALPDHFVLVLAKRSDTPIAAALNVRSGDRLYGRYWGAMEFVSGLHFETCYLQGIEYAIAHGLNAFEGGAQGEHKMARGLLPVSTRSAHWVVDRRFAAAIEDFLNAETAAVDRYQDELRDHSPFKASTAPE